MGQIWWASVERQQTPLNAVCERSDSLCKYSSIALRCGYEQKKVISRNRKQFRLLPSYFGALMTGRSCFHCLTLSFCKVAQNCQAVPRQFFLAFQRNILVVFSVDDVHKLQPQASSEHLQVLAGCALRMTGSDARSQLGHARTKKKPVFTTGFLARVAAKVHLIDAFPRVYDDSRARLQLSLCFYGQGAATTHDPSRLAGRRRRVKNYEHVHSGQCFSESLEQILVDELMSVSYITVIAELL